LRKAPKEKFKKKRSSAEKPAEIVAKVRSLAESLCDAEGVELVHLEYQRESGGRMLRLYIDRPGGIRIDDCVAISRQLSDLLDVYLDQEVAYNLEVSSPGLERPLGTEDDYNRFKGNQVRLKTYEPIEEQRKFKGVLLGLTEGQVNLRIDDNTVAIPFNLINKARLVNYHGE